MKRRAFMVAFAALGAAGFVRPDTLLLRKAKFEELGESVVATVSYPELLRTRDREAMASIDSGFETTLVFDVALYQHGSNQLVAQHQRVTTVRFDYINRRYEVVVRDDGRVSSRRHFKARDRAVAAATTLRRFRVGRSASLDRGESGPFYFCTVTGQRNPLSPAYGQSGLDPGTGRSQGRDTRWFSRFVNFLAGELPKAEAAIRYRTQPFYLVPR